MQLNNKPVHSVLNIFIKSIDHCLGILEETGDIEQVKLYLLKIRQQCMLAHRQINSKGDSNE